jgi:hypothetical protein
MRGAELCGTGMYRYIGSLAAILILAGMVASTQVAYGASETRYMCGEQHQVNGLTAYKLDISLSSTGQSVEKPNFGSGGGTIYWGIRVWKRESGGEIETTSGTPVAQVSRDDVGEGIQGATWVCPPTYLAETDSIVVRVYMDVNGTGWEPFSAEFITEELTARSLDNSTWMVYYYTKYETQTTGKPANRSTRGTFCWGDPMHNSRIEGFKWSRPTMTSAVADDNSGGGPGIQAGDRVVISFNCATNYPIGAPNIDTVLQLSDGHTWLDGSGNIGGASWDSYNDTLTITLSTGNGVPGVAVGDSVTIPAGTIIADGTDVTGSPPSITGGFGSGYLDVGPGYYYNTITAAIGAANSGDIIRVHPTDSTPDYIERVVVDKPNIIIAASSKYGYDSEATPEIQDTGDIGSTEAERNAFTIAATEVTLRGLNITYAPNSCIQIDSAGEDAVIDSCRVYGWEAVSNNIEGEIGGGIVVLANNVTIRNSTIDGAWGFVTTPFVGAIFTRVSTGEFGPNNTVANIAGTQLSGSVCLYSPATDPSGSVQVFDNTITDCYSGVYFHNNYAASNLEFRACNNEVIMSGSGGRGLQVSYIDSTSNNTVVFEKNTVWSRDRTVRGTYGVKAYNITDFSNNTITFQNNFIYDVYTGFDTQMGGGDGGHGIRAYNNTVYNFYFRGVDLRPPQADPSTHWEIKNNIIYSTTTDACGIYVPNGAGEGFSSDYNDIYVPGGIVGDWLGTVCPNLGVWRTVSGQDAWSISADPLLVSETMPDLHILASSPCIDKGWSVADVTDDIDGEVRPLGSLYDIGADEAEGVPDDTEAPSTPTGLTATAVSSSQIDLNWTASTDNVGVAGYNIYRDGVPIDTSTTTSYSDTGLSSSTFYTYQVDAFDVAANESDKSVPVSATTPQAQTIYVYSIDMSLKESGPLRNAIAKVTIKDSADSLVVGATVEGHWSGLTGDSDSGTTDTVGEVSLNSDKVKNTVGTFTFTIDDVVLSGWFFDPLLGETSNSISIP